MASSFLNSAGTDLDSLFYVSNSNAGALGFLVSGGQDLGNRYISGSLGYNVGYKNSAGTDLGYLRGNLVAPEGSVSATSKFSSNKKQYSCWYTSGEWDYVSYAWWSNGYINASLNLSNNAPISSVDWYLEYYDASSLSFNYVYTYYIALNKQTTFSFSWNCKNGGGYSGDGSGGYATISGHSTTITLKRSKQNTWLRSSKLATTTADNLTFTVGFIHDQGFLNQTRHRLVAHVHNAAGSTYLTSPEIAF